MGLRFGIIGSNFITDLFLEAAKTHADFELSAIYSRTEERAREFAEKHGCKNYFTSLSAMAESGLIDAVYIATPTALHAEQSLFFLERGIAVFCEKPAASNTREVKKITDMAREKGVLFMDGMLTPFEPRLKAVKDNLGRLGKIRRIIANFSQYSSRYDNFKNGIIENAFNPKLSNGAVMDIGIYVVEPVIQLLGKPNKVYGNALMLSTGVDGQGSMILAYDEMEVILTFSKIVAGGLPSEIQGEDGSIIIYRNNQQLKTRDDGTLFFRSRKGEEEAIVYTQDKHMMYYEIDEFISLYKAGKTESSVNNFASLIATFETIDEYRRQVGVVFPADEK